MYSIFNDYIKMGLITLPVKGKAPLVSGWTSIDTLERAESLGKHRLDSATGIGIRCGAINNIVVVDIDLDPSNKDDSLMIKEAIKAIPYSPVSKVGKKGPSLFFRKSGEIKSESIKWGNRSVIDILSDGRQTVVPPSIHPDTGKPYAWEGKGLLEVNVNALPIITTADIQKMKALFSIVKNENLYSHETVGRNDKLKSICAAKLKNGDSDKDIMEALTTYDVKHHEVPLLSDALEFGGEKDPKTNAMAFITSIRKSLGLMIKEARNPRDLGFIPANELPDVDNTQYIVEGLLVEGGTSLIVGPPKAGKSTLVRQMMAAISKGEDFLGNKCQTGVVLLFTTEDRPSEIKKHLIALGADLSKIHVRSKSLDSADKQSLINSLPFIKPKLVVLDPIVSAVGLQDLNKYQETYKDLEPLLEAAKASGANICMLHHMNKGSDKPIQEKVLGSVAITASVESIILLERKRQLRYLSSQCRYGVQLDEVELGFDEDTKSFWLQDHKVIKSYEQNLEDQICKYAMSLNDWFTRLDVRAHTGGKTQSVNKAIENLVLKGKLQRDVQNGKGKAIIYKFVQGGNNEL